MRRLKVFLCGFWILAVIASMACLIFEEKDAGAAGETPSRWPTAGLAIDNNRDTLVMFVHPQCPCTRASIEELNRLLAECGGKAAVHVFFYQPENEGSGWVHGSLWRSVAAIPGVELHEDPNGVMAGRFGAQTSGYVVLYSPAGRLLFAGGITAGRGHEGDNAGKSSITALLNGQTPEIATAPVYGCSLINCTRPAAQ
jgi:hypothetical protein